MESCPSVRELRRRWKPAKERLCAASNHATAIRMHRAFSWLARGEQAGDDDSDVVLVCLWIGFNGLYGQWDPARREPLPDRESWRRFMDRVLELDQSGHLAGMLRAQRELVMQVLGDPFVSSFFWEEPSELRAGKATKARFDARTWYLEERWGLLAQRLIERIYLMRCQLVHGAATFGGKLNRQSLDRCTKMLRHLLAAVLLVIIDHGADEDWGEMCYPPIGKAPAGEA